MQERPLFIPLRRAYFEAFARGEKREEFRRLGARWNSSTCRPGRRVVLSLGYGRASRLPGVVSSFRVCQTPTDLPGWSECYGSDSSAAACIGIALDT